MTLYVYYLLQAIIKDIACRSIGSILRIQNILEIKLTTLCVMLKLYFPRYFCHGHLFSHLSSVDTKDKQVQIDIDCHCAEIY